MPEALAVTNSTAKQYFKGVSDMTVRDYLFLALLEDRDRMKFDCSGADFIFGVKYDQVQVQTYASRDEVTFQTQDVMKQLTTTSKGLISTDQWSYKDSLMNRGDLAIYDYYARKSDDMAESLTDRIGDRLYGDGVGTDNIDGLDSFLGTSTTVAADMVFKPGDTYLGTSTAVATDSSVWDATLSTYPNASIATDWPRGKGATAYDWFSPTIINYGSTAYGTGSVLWSVNCAKAMRRMTAFLTKNNGKAGRPTIHLLELEMFNQYCDYQEAKFRNIIPHPKARDLGFPEVLNQDGVMVHSDFACPANSGYTVNVDQLRLLSLYDALFSVQGPEESIKDQAYLFVAGFFGNLYYLPRFHGKFKTT